MELFIPCVSAAVLFCQTYLDDYAILLSNNN